MDKNINSNENSIFDQLISKLCEKSIPEILEEMPNQELIKAFYMIKSDPKKIQELVLMDILKHAQNSKIGRENAFSEIKTVNAFRHKMPITEYSDYLSNIELMTKGESDIQYNGETVRFIATSGTTGISKLIPESKNSESVKALVSKIRMILLLSLAPEIMMPDKKVLSITNPAEYSKTEANIPIGSASGQAVKDIPKEMQQKLILPAELILAKDISNEAVDYLILLLALAEENLAGVVCSNIAHFNILFHKINDYAEDLLNDIKTGEVNSKLKMDEKLKAVISSKLTPNPQRAENLREIFESSKPFEVGRIWTNFSVVSCWMAASSERIVEDVRRRLPAKIKFLEWGYGASEGKFNIPSLANDPSGDLALFGYFFEFLPLGATDTLLAHELKAGEFYEIIITSYSGLYRYNIKDIIYVKSMENHSPRIVFASKKTEYLKLNDLELYVYEIEQYVKKTSQQVNEDIRFYQIIADESENKLVFIVEPFNAEFNGQEFISTLENILMSENQIYRSNRENENLKAAEIIIVEQGYRDALFMRSIIPGKNVNQTKLNTIVKVYPEEHSISKCYKGDAL